MNTKCSTTSGNGATEGRRHMRYNGVVQRNLIVHQYEEIDPAILFDLAKNRLGGLPGVPG